MDELMIDLTESVDDDADTEGLAMELWCSAREVCFGYFTIPTVRDKTSVSEQVAALSGALNR